jgi:outer membrane immunogenic protein
MKKLLFATTCAVGVSVAPAFAQNLSDPKGISSAPFTWTGCYVGGLAGYGFGQKGFADQTFTTGDFGLESPSSPSAHINGGLVGGQAGCDYQFASNWVIGAEAMAAWANIRGSSDPFFGGKAVFNAQTDWLASTTGRAGYAFDRWLVYGKGGVAWVGDKYSVPGTFAGAPFDLVGSETRTGWTIGAGVEWALLRNLSVDLEYNYYGFGTRSLTLTDATGETDEASIKQQIQTVTLGFNWRF